jgi:predicted ABC-type ATPase
MGIIGYSRGLSIDDKKKVPRNPKENRYHVSLVFFFFPTKNRMVERVRAIRVKARDVKVT